MEEQKKELISSRVADEGDFGNTWSGVGNLGRDPEMSYTNEGKAKTKFSMAIWIGTGQTMWLPVVVWEELAEEAIEKLNKGMRVKVVGRLKSYKWQGSDRFEILGSWIQILTKKPVVTVVEEVSTDRNPILDNTPF